ncbi:hypothetical protein CMO84_11750 [Candidatus Woesearchaeota archaeon]|nr:hypothetical protein [Candidatus Woesearchaeota archaeon]
MNCKPMNCKRLKWIGLLSLGLSAMASVAGPGCDVPVFRYALERWDPGRNPYTVVVFSRGTDDPASRKSLARLEELIGDSSRPVNLRLQRVDVDQESEAVATLKLEEKQLPWVRVEYPAWKQIAEPAWQGPLSSLDVDRLVDSPARRAIIKEILAGQSAVWVLIECGDPRKDDDAESILTKQLKLMEQQLKLPEGMEQDAEYQEGTQVALKIGFSVLRIDPDDPQERLFASLLLHTESDLLEFDEPIVLPIYGRGRAHLAHVGRGINADTIASTSQFLVGACSCIVAERNPGVDMIFSADWAGLIAGSAMAEKPLPELPAPSAEVEEPSTAAPGVAVLPGVTTADSGLDYLTITMGIIGLAVALVGAGALLVYLRRRERAV